MPRNQLRFGRGFGQAATMVLEPGETEGGPGNAHRGSDQWLYVLSGSGSATIAGGRHALKAGTLLLIERGVDTRSGTAAARRSRP